ncbi:MAG: molybdenum cofactor biosynthesis protein MoaE [Alphaproteobacteria bacterium]|jgi:molybdopterin synthase catalytic subunit|nr:molybdenum cofactor biosynthesis protein MoaE [Alphaproteobacteria bacterium]
MIRVQCAPFDAGAETAALTAGRDDLGAVVSFQGVVRRGDGPDAVDAMTLEHYPGMTERELERIEAEAQRRWPLQATLVIHRYGRMEPGEPIVLVVCCSRHRRAAFDACAFLMDWLKTRAPFWKLEETAAGARWVEATAGDEAAAARWSEP